MGWSRISNSANTKGKNASDIGLVIDAMDILHAGRFDGFVLVCSDSDFTRLASRIREQGLDVIGIGAKKTPEAFRMACNRFIFVENLGEEPAEAPTYQRGLARRSPRKLPLPRRNRSPAAKKSPQGCDSDLILRAMKKIEQDDDWYTLGQIGQFIRRPRISIRVATVAQAERPYPQTGRFEVKQGN